MQATRDRRQRADRQDFGGDIDEGRRGQYGQLQHDPRRPRPARIGVDFVACGQQLGVIPPAARSRYSIRTGWAHGHYSTMLKR
jgi:hypothetical protein